MIVFTLRILIPKSTSSLMLADVVIGSTVHPLAAWSALRLARRRRVPFVFEVRDLWPETLIDMGAIRRNGAIARLMRLLEGHLYRNAALIITTVPAASDYIALFGIDRDRIVWISNGADVDAFAVSPPPMNEVFEFLYCGAHGPANDLARILQGFQKASRELGDGSIRLKLVGSGPLKQSLIEEAAELGLKDSVEFHDPVSKSDIPALTASADALVISLLPLRLYRFGISPNKVFDYLAAARPILLAGNPINNAVQDADAGICKSSNSVEDISDAMVELYQSSYDQRAEWGRNGHEHARENYSFDHLAEKLDSHLRALTTKNNGVPSSATHFRRTFLATIATLGKRLKEGTRAALGAQSSLDVALSGLSDTVERPVLHSGCTKSMGEHEWN